jgi:hypothetical protein
MRTTKVKTRRGRFVLSKVTSAYAATLRDGEQDSTWTVTIGNTDLPAFISDGILYVQAPLPHIFQAFAEDLSDFLSDLEVRVSRAGGSTFSLDSDGRPIPGSTMAQPRVVPNRGERG